MNRRQVLAAMGSTSVLAAGCLEDTRVGDTSQSRCDGTITYARESIDYECDLGEMYEVTVRGSAENCSDLSLTTATNDNVVSLETDGDSWRYTNSNTKEMRGQLRGDSYQLLDTNGNVIAEKQVDLDQPQTLEVDRPKLDSQNLSVGDELTVTFAVIYRDFQTVRYTAKLLIDGTPTTKMEASLSESHSFCSSTTGPVETLTHRFERTGEFEVTVAVEGNGSYDSADSVVVGSVTVEE